MAETIPRMTNRQYWTIVELIREHQPECLGVMYRHPDGTVREFRYTDNAYLGINNDFAHWELPPIPDELLALIPDDENGGQTK